MGEYSAHWSNDWMRTVNGEYAKASVRTNLEAIREQLSQLTVLLAAIKDGWRRPMTDDIVTRLREHWEDEKMLGNDLLAEALGRAADEIERLRGLLWKYEHCEMVAESPCELDWHDGECKTCDDHNKAVRGE